MPYLKLWLVVIFLLAAGQISAQTGLTDTDKRTTPIFEAMYKTLLEKPKWLFVEDVCPFEVFPTVAVGTIYPFEACAENADICLEKCMENDGAACYSLAVSIQMKKGLEQTVSEFLFLRACRLGMISGCTNRAARILNDFPNDAAKLKCAADTFEKTCEKDDPWGCTMFGYILHMGISRPRDDAKALQVLAKSCKYGEEDAACVRAKELIGEITKSTVKLPK